MELLLDFSGGTRWELEIFGWPLSWKATTTAIWEVDAFGEEMHL